MDFVKFSWMLMNQAIFVPSLLALAQADPYEGYVPITRTPEHIASIEEARAALDARATTVKSAKDKQFLDELRSHFLKSYYHGWQTSYGASCWHANDGESEAMWKLYSGKGFGVAIESTVSRIGNAFSKKRRQLCLLAPMNYDDFSQPGDERILPFVSKRKCFEHEKEVRATISLQKPGFGEVVHCDIGALIVKVHVAPDASQFFVNTVEQACSRLVNGVEFSVKKSRLYEFPWS